MKKVHALRSDATATNDLTPTFVQPDCVQGRPLNLKLQGLAGYYKLQKVRNHAGGVQHLPCGCQVFVAAGSEPVCPMHGAAQEAA